MATERKENAPQPEQLPYDQRIINLFEAEKDNKKWVAEDYFRVLGNVGTPKAVEFVISQVPSHEDRIVEEARKAIGHLPSETTVLPLVRRVVPEASGDIPSTTHLLKEIEEDQRAELLKIAILSGIKRAKELKSRPGRERSPVENASIFLAETLVQKSIKAVQDLEKQRKELYPAVTTAFLEGYSRQEALEVLAAGGNEAISSAVKITVDGEYDYIREAGIKVLMIIDTNEAWEALQENQEKMGRLSGEELEKVLKRDNSRFRPVVLRSLSKEKRYSLQSPPGSVKAIDFLIRTAEEGKQDELVPALAWHMRSQNEEVAQKAAETLKEIASEKAIDALVEALRETDLATEKLAQLVSKHEKIIEKLVTQVPQFEEGARERIKNVLKEADQTRVAETINAALNQEMEEKGKISYQVAYLAPELQLSECIPVLKEAMAKEDYTAGPAIAKYGTRETLDLLSETLLGDPNPNMRKHAASALRYFPFDQTQRTQSKEQEKRLVELTRGRVGSPKQEIIATLLAAAWDDPEPEVRHTAIRSLGELGNEEVGQLLYEKLADESQEVARAAIRAIDSILERERKSR